MPWSVSIQAALEPRIDRVIAGDADARSEGLNASIRFAMPASSAIADRESLDKLAAAADAFVVRRGARTTHPRVDHARRGVLPGDGGGGGEGVSITFISLPGLLLCTGRFEEARATLATFAAARRNGLIPNVFNDQTGEPEYNTVDGSLWFIHAACEYVERSGDDGVLAGEIGKACLDVIAHYRRGTDHSIAMDPFDKLIAAGSESSQLTWMDARRDGVTFTPRFGKPVEINALWCSALLRLADLLAKEQPTLSANLLDLGAAAGKSFAAAFWNDSASCLFDCLVPVGGGDGWAPSAEIRPNQLFAVSLPHSPLTAEQQRSVLACVKSRLLTPLGVRTLDPADRRYRGRYEGSLFDRDAAYHQGTAWPWLTGVLAMAVLREGNCSEQSRREARAILAPLIAELDGAGPGGGCTGFLAEVYDGDAPQRPGGCPAQAWSIATVLQAMCMLS
jgi:predicted glycogen debranching enzyme